MATFRPGDWSCSMCDNHNFGCVAIASSHASGGALGAFGVFPPRAAPVRSSAKVHPSACTHPLLSHQPAPRRPLGDVQWVDHRDSRAPYTRRQGLRGLPIASFNRTTHTGAPRFDSTPPHLPPRVSLIGGGWLGGHSSREFCNNCAEPRRLVDATIQHGQVRPGDWVCAQCDNLNFASRSSCKKCNGDKTQCDLKLRAPHGPKNHVRAALPSPTSPALPKYTLASVLR
jgi:hypothetical protein